MGNKKTKKAESWVTKNKGGRELGYKKNKEGRELGNKKTKKVESWVIQKMC